MTKAMTFDVPAQRFDDHAASAGVDFPMVDELGQYWNTWTITYRDESSQKYRAAEKLYYKQNANRIRQMKDDVERELDKLVELNIVGWKDVKSGGKDVPFTKQNAKDFLMQPDFYWIASSLFRLTANVFVFQKDGVATKEEIAGN